MHHGSPFSLRPILMAAHFHRARFSFCRGCESRKGVRMTSWPRNPLMEISADFAVTPATRIQRAPNESALPRSRSSELPTQPKAWNAPKIRWLRHPLTGKRAGFAVTLATRIQRAPNGNTLLRSHSSKLLTQPKAWNPSRCGSFRADCAGLCIAGAQ